MLVNITDPWTVLSLEVDSLVSLTQETTAEVFDQLSDRAQQLVTYNLAKQARDVIDILLSRYTRPDAVALARMMPDFRSESLDRLRAEYGDDQQVGSPCWLLGSLMNAPAIQGEPRGRRVQALIELILMIDRIWREIEPHREARRRQSTY